MCILPLSDQAENTNLIQNKKTQKTDETYFAASYLKNVFLKHFYREKKTSQLHKILCSNDGAFCLIFCFSVGSEHLYYVPI